MEETKTLEARSSKFSFPRTHTIVNVLLFLIPTLFVPLTIIPLQFTKTFVALVALVLLAAILFASAMRQSSLTLQWSMLIVSVWLLPVAYLFSAIFSQSPTLSFLGYQLGTDTFGFMLLAASLVSVIVATYKKERLSGAFMALLYAAWATFAFQLLQILFKAPFPFEALNDVVTNSLGRWNDFGVFAGLIATLVLLAYLSARVKRAGKIALIATFASSLLFMALVNLKEVWVVFGIISLALSIMMLGQLRSDNFASLGRSRIALPIIGVVCAIFFAFFGTGTASMLQNVAGTNSLEVRPSIVGTFDVFKSVYATDPVFGTGPGTFAEGWNLYRPVGVLTSFFWNTSFNVGSGLILTSFITGGLVVMLAWLLLTVMILYTVFRALFRAPTDAKSYMFSTLSALGLLYLLVMHYVYTPSQSLSLLFALFLSLFLVSLKGTPLVKDVSLRGTNPAKHYALVVGVVFVGILLVADLYSVGKMYVSNIYHERAIVQANNGNLDTGEKLVAIALRLNEQDRYYRTKALLHNAQFNQAISAADENSTAEDQAAFQVMLSQAIENANLARQKNPNEYENLLVRALIFSNLVPLRVEGALENAVLGLEEARMRNPKAPEIDYRLAELAIADEKNEEAREHLHAALEKKANYTSAILLLAQIDLQEGNLKEAIESVRAAVFFEPQNSLLLYQLGILLLQDAEYEQAAAAFELALQIEPNYANAAFFLAQSYAFLDRIDDAASLMRELKRTNPGNETVDSYLSALDAGSNPFNPQNIASPESEDGEEIN